MTTALEFLEAILATEALPERCICFDNVQLPHVVAYSDAEGVQYGISLVIFDPLLHLPPIDLLTGVLAGRYRLSTTCPEWLLARLRDMHPRDDDQGLINCVELIDDISLFMTFADVISDRHAASREARGSASTTRCRVAPAQTNHRRPETLAA